MVLKVETDTRKVNNGLDAGAAKLVGVTCRISQLLSLRVTDSGIDIPMPDRWRIRGDDSVPPDTTICLRARKTRTLRSYHVSVV
jgi:hypothetical protein